MMETLDLMNLGPWREGVGGGGGRERESNLKKTLGTKN